MCNLRFLGASFVAAAFLLLPSAARAQFSSGSDGSDGALNITANTVLPVQEDGVHNYTTINVGASATLSFKNNSRNTPVIFLATGDVTINGAIDLRGDSGRSYGDPRAAQPGNEAVPGPGGFPGGLGAQPVINGGSGIGTSGGGPGGGQAANDPSPDVNGRGRGGNAGSHFTAGAIGAANANPAAPTYGDVRLLALSGGSGGAGANAVYGSPTTLHGSAGGAGGAAYQPTGEGSNAAGSGAGGAIRLMANSIEGTGALYAKGSAGGVAGGDGEVRLEALLITGPSNIDVVPQSSIPSAVALAPGSQPTVRITSIAGIAVPDPPTGSTATPDVTIPTATSNPIQIQMQTTNVPDGSTIHLRIVLGNGDILTVNSNPVASNAATAEATLPKGVGVLYATATFGP